MQRRKGFTLVELVIVIAVIAILAGVLIGTFASVLSKANESARMQEMKAAEHDQKASDILNKLNNAEWFGWEDLEAKIGEAVQSSISNAMSGAKSISAEDLKEVKEAVAAAVDTAIAKYAVSQGQDNTQLTAEQVQYIVEQAVSKRGGVTEAQVQAIVTNATKNLNTQTPLTANQVQRIVDAAVKKVTDSGLTASDLATALANVAKTTDLEFDDVLKAINTAASKQSTLTADEVAAIVSKYVTTDGTAKGDFTWYVPEATELVIDKDKAAEQVVGLATVSASGESFEGKTITLPEKENIVLDTSEGDWNPIKVFAGTLDGNGSTISGVDFEIVYYSSEEKATTGSSAWLGPNSAGDWYGDKMGFGFINVLTGTVKDITVNYNMTEWSEDPNCKYTYFGGIAGAVNSDAVIENCHVTGTIKAWGRVGGLVGYVKDCALTIKNCSVEANISSRLTSKETDYAYASVAGLVGWHGKDNKALTVAQRTITFEGTNTVKDSTLTVYAPNGSTATAPTYVAKKVANYGSDYVTGQANVTATNVTKTVDGTGSVLD